MAAPPQGSSLDGRANWQHAAVCLTDIAKFCPIFQDLSTGTGLYSSTEYILVGFI
jgi:hypothetical protein